MNEEELEDIKEKANNILQREECARKESFKQVKRYNSYTSLSKTFYSTKSGIKYLLALILSRSVVDCVKKLEKELKEEKVKRQSIEKDLKMLKSSLQTLTKN
eukprot:TRINITY_DN14019_c0_g1_i1.p2 TRINITY_DN14019_c0_g1~~TRINITY_DN14019_c0_g1_i1.p2  ORF type:complete len:102 (+),score=26.79 TRINITY_DN14019_c0_g1_i1:801-1106(+)